MRLMCAWAPDAQECVAIKRRQGTRTVQLSRGGRVAPPRGAARRNRCEQFRRTFAHSYVCNAPAAEPRLTTPACGMAARVP